MRIVHHPAGMSAAFVIGLAFILPSCSPGGGYEAIEETGASLSGTVTYKNQPVEVAFIHIAGPQSGTYGHVEADGRYTISRVPIGNVKIGVDTASAIVKAKAEMANQRMGAMYGGDKKSKVAGGGTGGPKFIEIPKQYADPKTSGLSTTIQRGENTFNIEIE